MRRGWKWELDTEREYVENLATGKLEKNPYYAKNLATGKLEKNQEPEQTKYSAAPPFPEKPPASGFRRILENILEILT